MNKNSKTDKKPDLPNVIPNNTWLPWLIFLVEEDRKNRREWLKEQIHKKKGDQDIYNLVVPGPTPDLAKYVALLEKQEQLEREAKQHKINAVETVELEQESDKDQTHNIEQVNEVPQSVRNHQ